MREFVNDESDAHVTPRDIQASMMTRFAKKLIGLVNPRRKQIYNQRSKHKAEMRGERNRGQQLLFLAREHGYIYFKQAEVSGNLSHIFVCHPEAAKMYRAWPYVVVIDSTYNTNCYELPVVEMIGVTPVGNNFLIAYAMVKGEKYANYLWVLECLKQLLPEGLEPGAIITDRELGLIKALNIVFPRSYHMLCVFHIYNAVEAYALNLFHDRSDAKMCARWHFLRVVQASTEKSYAAAWKKFEHEYNKWKELVDYVWDTWIAEKRIYCWAWCYTNQVFHLQNTATSRVEAAHAVLKLWLRSQAVACDTLWERAHAMMEQQQSVIRSLLAESYGKKVVDSAGVHAHAQPTHTPGSA